MNCAARCFCDVDHHSCLFSANHILCLKRSAALCCCVGCWGLCASDLLSGVICTNNKSDSSEMRLPAAKWSAQEQELPQQLTPSSLSTSSECTYNLIYTFYNNYCLSDSASFSHLTILPDLRVCLSTALDLLHQGSKGLEGAWVDEWEVLPLFKCFICSQTQTPAINYIILNHMLYLNIVIYDIVIDSPVG